MAVVLSDVVDLQITQLKSKQQSVLRKLKCFIMNLEQNEFYPSLLPLSVGQEYGSLSTRVQYINTELDKYDLFDASVVQYTDSIDSQLEGIADRFWDYMNRKFFSVTEAMGLVGKSRSTIYRWIKSGKLVAQKENRRWVIAM
jgi:hypothetical protein